MQTNLEMIFKAIAEESEYQKKKYPDHKHSIGEWALHFQEYSARVIRAWVIRAWFNKDGNALNEVRKLAALCVACMEEHEAPFRRQPPDITYPMKEQKPVNQQGWEPAVSEAMSEEESTKLVAEAGLKSCDGCWAHFQITDAASGPTLTIETSHYGNCAQRTQLFLDERCLKALANMFALAKDHQFKNTPYCYAFRVQGRQIPAFVGNKNIN